MHDREPTGEPPTARALAEVRSPGSGDPSGLTPASETRVVWARGSSAEIDTQLVLAEELGYLTRDELAPAIAISDEVGRLLNAVITALHRRLNDQPPAL